MSNDFQYDVFLSHNHTDKLRVRRLASLSQLSTFRRRLFPNRTQSRTLVTLRDTLLPKLLSGELSVAGGNYSVLSNSSKRTKTTP